MEAAARQAWSNRLHALLLGLALLLAAGSAVAQKRGYALDEDPIRLGFKALEAGQLGAARSEFLRAVADDYQAHRARFGLAELALREGRFVESEQHYREAIALETGKREGYPEASAGLGLLLLRLGSEREEEAAAAIALALAGDDRLWTAHYGQARLLLRQGKPEEARAHLKRGGGRKGAAAGEDLYHHGMALYQLETGDLDGAEREALLALYLNPGDPQHGELVGRVYERRQEPALAISAYERALTAPGQAPSPPGLHALGQLCQRSGRFNDAREYYLRAMAADSTYTPALRDLAGLLREADQHEQAARTYLRYVELVPTDTDALLNLADACYEIGQYAQGFAAAGRARALAPAVEADFAAARCGIHTREPALRAEAAALMAALPDSLPWQARDLVALAALLGERGELAAAATQLERALLLDPAAADARFQLGMVKLKQGHAQAAIVDLAAAATLKPEAAIYRINLGIARFQTGDYLGAMPEFKQALALDPGLTVGRLLLAQAYAVSDSLAAAQEQYSLVLAAEPANAKALRGLGFCHVRAGRYAEAVAVYRQSTVADPQDADGWAGLGNAHLGSGDFAAARTAFDRARALDPDNATMKKGRELLDEAERARPAGD